MQYNHVCLLSDVEEEQGGPKPLDVIYKTVGEPRNYGLSPEEKEEAARRALEAKVYWSYNTFLLMSFHSISMQGCICSLLCTWSCSQLSDVWWNL